MRENLRSLHQARGWTIEELSKKSRIRAKILLAMEEGRDFDVVYLIRLSKLYHIKPAELFSGVITPPVEKEALESPPHL